MAATSVIKPPKDSIFIIDWDNTLFSTSYLKNMGFQFDCYFDKSKEVSEVDKALDHYLIKDISALEDELISFLERIFSYGLVYIVSNAAHTWVHKCLQHFYPRLYEVTLTKKTLPIEIISARDLFACSIPNDPQRWKINAFVRIVAQNSLKQAIRNVFSFGDSLLERKALFTAAKSIEARLLSKSVKFMESADIRALKGQISILNHNIESLITHPNDIDLVITLGVA